MIIEVEKAEDCPFYNDSGNVGRCRIRRGSVYNCFGCDEACPLSEGKVEVVWTGKIEVKK